MKRATIIETCNCDIESDHDHGCKLYDQAEKNAQDLAFQCFGKMYESEAWHQIDELLESDYPRLHETERRTISREATQWVQDSHDDAQEDKADRYRDDGF